jgi:predicted ArsR family transcriptional regulator
VSSVMDLFQFAERYPNAPGYRQTETSKAAAESMKADAGLIRSAVVAALQRHGPMTADQCAVALTLDKLSVRPRLSELRELGRVEDSGERRSNASGRSAIVWRLTHTN